MSWGNISEEIQKGNRMIFGSATWDPGNLASAAQATTDITATGAVLGDYVLAVSFSVDVADLQLTADVTTANTVTAVISNTGATTVDLASGTVRIIVMKRSELSGS